MAQGKDTVKAPAVSPAPKAPETTGRLVLDGACGWVGVRNNEHPDSAFSLATGPTSP